MPTPTLPEVLAYLDTMNDDAAAAVDVLSREPAKDGDHGSIRAEVVRMLTAAHALLAPTIKVRQAWRWLRAWQRARDAHPVVLRVHRHIFRAENRVLDAVDAWQRGL